VFASTGKLHVSGHLVRNIPRTSSRSFQRFTKNEFRLHFTREDLQEIIKWKHRVDYTRQVNALEGLASFPEDQIIGLTRYISESIQLSMNRFVSPVVAGEEFPECE
jgi:hypothetical protein